MAQNTAENVDKNATEVGWNTVVEPYGDTFPFNQEGDTLVGKYLSSRIVEQDGLDGNPRSVNVYEIVDANGQKWSVWESYAIKVAFDKITPGSEVRIIFQGVAPLDGGRTVKKFTVQSR